MKQLRQYIRRILLESPCDTTNNKIFQAIEELAFHRLKVHWNKSSRGFVIKIVPDNGGDDAAYLDASGVYPDPPCRSAFIIAYTEVSPPYRHNSGFGALIYDIALELAGKKGLASDRMSVSRFKSGAIRMWEYFYSSDDYDKKPFDNENGEFTPNDPNDDCEAESYLKHGGDYGDDQEYFQSHPLNNVYYKKDQSQPTIRCLREMKLVLE